MTISTYSICRTGVSFFHETVLAKPAWLRNPHARWTVCHEHAPSNVRSSLSWATFTSQCVRLSLLSFCPVVDLHLCRRAATVVAGALLVGLVASQSVALAWASVLVLLVWLRVIWGVSLLVEQFRLASQSTTVVWGSLLQWVICHVVFKCDVLLWIRSELGAVSFDAVCFSCGGNCKKKKRHCGKTGVKEKQLSTTRRPQTLSVSLSVLSAFSTLERFVKANPPSPSLPKTYE